MQIGDSKPIPYLAPTTETRLDAVKRSADKGDSKETSKQFETLFGVMLVRELRRAMPDGIFGSGAGSDVYEGWFDEHLGNALASRDALGIAGMVKTALGRAQAARDAQTAMGIESAPATKSATELATELATEVATQPTPETSMATLPITEILP